MASDGAVTAAVRKADQVAELIRARVADGTLKPGAIAPSSVKLAKETGFAAKTCQKGLQLLFAKGELTRVSRSGLFRVPCDGSGWDGQELSEALATRRVAAGLLQAELAAKIGMSVTIVGHAETGRLWQSRTFWEKTDQALSACGDLLALFDAWRERSAAGTTRKPETPAPVSVPDVLAVAAEVVITLPCDPVPVTVRWRDGSVTTVRPGPSSG